MADVFISYKSDDRARVQTLVTALRGRGFDVWWDKDIPVDAPWEQTIERELRNAKAAVVVWSPAAVISDNVKSEARWARQEGKLIQVFVEGCDPPLFFGERQGVDLAGWKGDARDPRFGTVVAAIAAILAGKAPPLGVGYAPRPRRPWRAAAGAGAVAVVGLSLIGVFGGAREALCNLDAVRSACLRFGLAKAPAAPVLDPVATARTRLIQSIAGDWRRPDGSCAQPLAFAVAKDAAGVWRITVSTKGGYLRTGQVLAADNGVVVSQDNTDQSVMQYRPNGDQLTGRDHTNTDTTLYRCPTRQPGASP